MLTKEQEAVVDIVCSTTDKTIAVNSVAGSGKGLWECTAILTKKGYVALRDLKEGDHVIGKDGKETKIIGYYPRGFQPCYKMTFSNGHTLMCDKDHLWTFCYSHERSKNPFPTYHTLSVESLVKLPLRKKSGKYSTWNLYLPLVDPVQFNEDEVPDFDPYVLGIIIGDGCLRDHCGFSNTEQDIIDTVTTYANSLGDTVRKSGENDYRFTGTNILKYLRKIGLDDTYSCDRFIPKSYLYGSIQTRLDILAGLLDTDGTVILSNKVKRIGSSYEYSTTSYKLFTEVTFLCESLGLTVTQGVKEEPTYLYKEQKRVGRKAYRLYIKPSKRFPKLHRSAKHDARWNPTPQTSARIYIKDIKPCAYHKTICIKVDAEDELFVTERCLVTHNTTTCAAVVDACKPKKGFYTAFNKAIVQDSAKRFGDKVTCKTIHALAYKYVRPKRSVEELNYLTIKENLSYEDKATIIQALDDFFRSSYTDLELFLNIHNSKDSHLHDIILNYADMMLEGKIPPTFNFLLKCLHIMLKDKELSIDFDLLCLDECLTGDMFVTTDKGQRTIQAICNDLKKGKEVFVESYDVTSDSMVYKKAKNPLISTDRDILEVKTEGLNKLKCTPNHKLLTQRGYVEVRDLQIGKDYILLENSTRQKSKKLLNDDQLQVVLGSYLGDGNVRKQSKFNTYRCRLTQSIDYKAYLEWKADCLGIKKYRLEKSGYTGKVSIIQTNYTPTFILPDDIFQTVLDKLNPLGLAIWFMDDGSRYKIHSNSFSKEENELLCDMLQKRFGISGCVIQETNGLYAIHIKDELSLYKVIKEYLRPEFTYKFHRKVTGNVTELDPEYRLLGANYVQSVEPIGTATVYDFEVEDTHNFLVSSSRRGVKIISHNCQDVTAVTLEIFKLINAEHKVMFGDRYQNIYSFMDTVNAFEELEGVETLHLTRSFRCSPLIASIVEDYGRKYLGDDFRFEGNPDIAKTTDTIAFISRTNASLIERMYKLMNKGRKFSLTRDINEIFSLPIALLSANNNKPVFYQKYKFIQKEYIKYRSSPTYHRTFFDYLIDTTKDVAIENGCKLLLDLNKRGINIYDLKKKVQDMDPDPNTILTTAHAFKGLEADTVYIEDDLNKTLTRLKPDMNRSKSTIENLNTYYVALSRARFSLANYV